jgi:hypothetical protein
MWNESSRFLVLTFQKMCCGFLCNNWVMFFSNLMVFVLSVAQLVISLTQKNST